MTSIMPSKRCVMAFMISLLNRVDEIEFAATLTKLKDKLILQQEELARNERLLGGEMIKSLILGEASEASIAEWEQRLNLSKADRLYYLLAELNDNYNWHPYEEKVPYTRFKELVQQELTRITSADQPICLNEHRNRIGILLPSYLLARCGGDLERLLTAFRDALDAHLGKGVFLYAGSAVQHLSEIRESYKTAKEASLHKYIYEDNRIVSFDQKKLERLNYIGFDPAEFNLFMEQMEELQLEAVKTIVDKWFIDFREKRYAPEAVKMNIQLCLMGILKTIRNMEGMKTPCIHWDRS